MHIREAEISVETAFFLGVVSTLVTLVVGWALLRLTGPWVNAKANGIPLSLLDLIGMRLRRTDAGLLVNTAVVLQRLGESVELSELEVAYLSLPENKQDLTELMRSVRPQLTARLEAEAQARAARDAT